ncbi:helix-turn-helix domain-containing protein [Nocardia sp. BMG51109]|uniref:helix-turn-helix domain-containing protein n=1 Tax=Nocardia sp. BMG51109 TaxID=1056816 RepID=UPI0005688092|nr:helix-turn-helix transcriptional regulator [Nocardia sp. BMG51109]
MTTGEVIRRIRKSLGMTQSELGAVLGYTQPAISQLEHDGAAVHDVRVLRRVAKALQVPLAILVVESNEEADVNRRNFLRTGAMGAGAAVGTGVVGGSHGAGSTSAVARSDSVKIGAGDVAEITANITQIHELDRIVGGDRLCRLAAHKVRYVEYLLDSGSYNDDIGRQLTSTAAEMMTAAGWVCYDAGRLDQARRYYADAAQAAAATNDGIAVSHALINACLLSYRDGIRPREGVQLAEAAQRAAMSHGGPKLRALAATREAEAQAAVGDKQAMRAAVSRAHRAYASSRGHDPEYLVSLPETTLNGLIGLAFKRLGDHEEAAAHLQAAIDGTTAYPRQRTGWQLGLAENWIEAGDVAEGCALLSTNFEAIGSVASTRSHTRLNSIAHTVRPHNKVPEVREFLGMVAERG